MSAYAPSECWVAAVLATAFLVVLIAGYATGRYLPAVVARPLAWTTLVLGTLGVERWVADEPAGVRMLGLITFVLLVMKVIVVIEKRDQGMGALSCGGWLGFAGAWLGMKPELFASAET